MVTSSPTGPAPRTQAQEQKARREAHQAAQQAVADQRNAELNAYIAMLEGVLIRGLKRRANIDLAGRRRLPDLPRLDLGEAAEPLLVPQWAHFAPPAPGWLERTFGNERRHADKVADAEARFAAAQEHHARMEAERQAHVVREHRQHAAAVQRAKEEAAQANAALDRWITGLKERRREDVERYLSEVLAAVVLPKGFPRRGEVTYDTEAEHAVVRFSLPGPNSIPSVREVTYVKTRDELKNVPRPPRDSQRLYKSLISQVSLLVIRDLFDADNALRQISFNGHLSRTHPATGQADYPCLISVVVSHEEFAPIVLSRVSPEDCLQHLKALVSHHPYTVEPVRPLVDFDRSRYAFTQAVDVLSGLDHRDDLMTLSPTEFEHLVRQLFEAIPGMEGWTTQPAKDDGIDGVIFNNTPITGGLTVVQAKQYSKTIGVEHVRELMGAMEHKRAGRGVLVTTSTFTKDARALGADYGGRIQLIDGAELAYLMKQHLGKEVLIGRRGRKTRQ